MTSLSLHWQSVNFYRIDAICYYPTRYDNYMTMYCDAKRLRSRCFHWKVARGFTFVLRTKFDDKILRIFLEENFGLNLHLNSHRPLKLKCAFVLNILWKLFSLVTKIRTTCAVAVCSAWHLKYTTSYLAISVSLAIYKTLYVCISSLLKKLEQNNKLLNLYRCICQPIWSMTLKSRLQKHWIMLSHIKPCRVESVSNGGVSHSVHAHCLFVLVFCCVF